MDNDKLSWSAQWLSTAGQTHPWTVLAPRSASNGSTTAATAVLAKPAEVRLLLPAESRASASLRRGLRRSAAFCVGCGAALRR